MKTLNQIKKLTQILQSKICKMIVNTWLTADYKAVYALVLVTQTALLLEQRIKPLP